MAPKVAGEDISIRRRRLQYRAAHRGTRELDMLLGPFAAARAQSMDALELDALERLLDEADTDLQMWFLGETIPPAHQRPLIQSVLSFKQSTR